VSGALARLESVGLVSFTGSFVVFATSSDSLRNVPGELLAMLRNVLSVRRIPIPRPMLRLLARTPVPSLAATVFAYLMRCVSWRGSELHVNGSCTVRFVSERFGMDARSVKRARAELRRIGWLEAARFPDGACVEGPNLAWLGSTANLRSTPEPACTVLSPSATKQDTKMSPLAICTQLRTGKDQQLREPSMAGIQDGEEGTRLPRLSDVQRRDLSSADRLAALFEEAGSRGLIGRSEADRLRFFAAAARASRLACRNPGGFFAAIVRRGLWHVINQADEDLAVQRLKQLAGHQHRDIAATRDVSHFPRPSDCPAVVSRLVEQVAVARSMNKRLAQPMLNKERRSDRLRVR